MKTIPFNVNNYVRVKITEFGKRKILEDHEEFVSGLKLSGFNEAFFTSVGIKPPEIEEDETGYHRIQLWRLMQLLGPHCANGVSPFETEILLET